MLKNRNSHEASENEFRDVPSFSIDYVFFSPLVLLRSFLQPAGDSVSGLCIYDSSSNQIKRLLMQSRCSNGITDSRVWRKTDSGEGKRQGRKRWSNGPQRWEGRRRRRKLLPAAENPLKKKPFYKRKICFSPVYGLCWYWQGQMRRYGPLLRPVVSLALRPTERCRSSNCWLSRWKWRGYWNLASLEE